MATRKPQKKFIYYQARANRILAANSSDFNTFPAELVEDVQILWKDKAIQDSFERSNEFQLIDGAP